MLTDLQATVAQTTSQRRSEESHRSDVLLQPEAEAAGQSQWEVSPTTARLDQDEASFADPSALSLREVAPFLYYSQPPHSFPTSAQPHIEESVGDEIVDSSIQELLAGDAEGVGHQVQSDALSVGTQSSANLATSQITPVEPGHPENFLVASTQTQLQSSKPLHQCSERGIFHSQSPTHGDSVLRAVDLTEAVVHSTYEANYARDDLVRRRDFVGQSEPPQSTEPLTESLEQNAQIVSPDKGLSTQEDIVESAIPTIELEIKGPSSPASRHDSSQDSPDRHLHSPEHSSSPIPQPPTHSISELDSQAPVRPETPGPTSSASKMASPELPKSVKQQLEEGLAKEQAARPWTPIRRTLRPTNSPTTPTTQTGPRSPPPSGTRLLGGGVSPAVEGTRSPSIIPEHSPAPPAPTSLRTIALTRSTQLPTEPGREKIIEEKKLTPPLELNIAHATSPPIPAIVTTEATVPDVVSTDDEELVDADDDDDTPSILNDDLTLAVEEYIVPLFIEARQSDMYSLHINDKRRIFEDFLKDPHGFEPLASIQEAVQYLRAIETHIDLVFAEAAPALDNAIETASQVKLKADWGTENSIKFRFLHTFFKALRDHDKHVVLVIAEDSQVLFDIIETFCKAEKLQYNMPTQGRDAARALVEGTVSVTVIARKTSPIIRPGDVIICLDGVQDAKQLREKNWALNPELDVVPVLHLVIPRTVSHIERYLSSSLDERKRIHTILASLAQMSDEWGKPINPDTLRARDAANRVAEWLLATPEEVKVWPLGPIGSVEEVVEFQTQWSPSPIVGANSAPERSKRPHVGTTAESNI
jgi:hypothetical protein